MLAHGQDLRQHAQAVARAVVVHHQPNTILQPTNNAAEQALRSLVLKRKISGPTGSRRGDQFLSWGFSVHETCRRQGGGPVAIHASGRCGIHRQDRRAEPAAIAHGLRAYGLTPAHGQHSQPPLLAIPPTTRCSILLVGTP